MYFQTGSIVGRSMTQDGDLNHGKVPIQELNSSSGGQKIQSLIQTYQYYLQMIRDVTGLNEARDASTPDKDALVGLQKLAAAQSNVATRHLLQASLFLTLRACENIALRISDCLEFDLTREALIDSISAYNVGTLQELQTLNLFDFGIFLELEPDEEEKAILEQNIQMAIQQGGINLEDAIDIRQVNNLKLANQLLKLKRKQNAKIAQEAQQANIRAQAEAQTRQREEEAMFEVQKQQALSQTNIEFEKAKSQFELERLQTEMQLKKEILEVEFVYDMQIEKQKIKITDKKELMIEDRKDQRSKQEATQQSQLINQSQNDLLPTDFNNQI
jgi:DNA-dependent RNA polymerase auxiliary subunit epsilon